MFREENSKPPVDAAAHAVAWEASEERRSRDGVRPGTTWSGAQPLWRGVSSVPHDEAIPFRGAQSEK